MQQQPQKMQIIEGNKKEVQTNANANISPIISFGISNVNIYWQLIVP
jgi:hypothetical protein